MYPNFQNLKSQNPSQKAAKYQKGIGLPATVFIIVILSLIVSAMGDLTESSNIGFGQDYQSMHAFYAAESGAQVALNRVFVGGTACGGLSNLNFGSSEEGLGDCSVVLSCSPVTVSGIEYRTFISTATCGSGLEQSTRSIEVRAK